MKQQMNKVYNLTKSAALIGNVIPKKTGPGEHARHGRNWTRPRVQFLAQGTATNAGRLSVRAGISAWARKTAPGAGALPKPCRFRANRCF